LNPPRLKLVRDPQENKVSTKIFCFTSLFCLLTLGYIMGLIRHWKYRDDSVVKPAAKSTICLFPDKLKDFSMGSLGKVVSLGQAIIIIVLSNGKTTDETSVPSPCSGVKPEPFS
jgi:hypothetical protein